MDEASFNTLFNKCPVLRYWWNGAVHSVYFRTSPPEVLASPYKLFTETWTDTDNVLNTDFKMFSSFEEAKNGMNAWQHCVYNGNGIGYPFDCGPQSAIRRQYFTRKMKMGTIHQNVGAFDIYTGDDCPVTTVPSPWKWTSSNWTRAVANIDSGLVQNNMDEASFNTLFNKCPVLRYWWNGAVHSVYFRTSPPEVLASPYKLFTETWTDTDNVLNTDFKMFSSFQDAKNEVNAWQSCNYNAPGNGYPRDCGPTGPVRRQYFTRNMKTGMTLQNVGAFDIYTGEDCPYSAIE